MRWPLVVTNAALVCGIFSMGARAQEATPTTNAPPPAAAAPAPGNAAACDGCLTVPALTPVRIELLTTLGSAISKSGDSFPIRLAEPIMIDGKEAVPAGTTGIGEVVHAKKSGGSGAAGELVLAARYLDVDGRRLRLRSMALSSNGKSAVEAAHVMGFAGGGIGALVGFLMKGGKTTVESGTVTSAKTAEAFIIAPASIQTAAEASVSAAPAPAKVSEQQ